MAVQARQIAPEALPKVAMMIAAGLMGGCAFFVAFAYLLATMQPNWQSAGPLTLVALVMGLSATVLAFVLPGILARAMVGAARLKQGAATGEPEAEIRVAGAAALNQIIVRQALLEGAALMAGIAVLIEGTWLALGVAAFLLALMLALFPWPSRFEAARDRLRELMQ
jgi:hypothetical protein